MRERYRHARGAPVGTGGGNAAACPPHAGGARGSRRRDAVTERGQRRSAGRRRPRPGGPSGPGPGARNRVGSGPAEGDTRAMRGRLGAILDGAGWSIGLAAALFLFALLFLALQVQSPDIVLWTGDHVAATEQGGLATFRWHGQAS